MQIGLCEGFLKQIAIAICIALANQLYPCMHAMANEYTSIAAWTCIISEVG